MDEFLESIEGKRIVYFRLDLENKLLTVVTKEEKSKKNYEKVEFSLIKVQT